MGAFVTVSREGMRMRQTILKCAVASALALLATNTLALDRLPTPEAGMTAIVKAADLDRPSRPHVYRHSSADDYWNWRYRASYIRWMHNEYVRAGYPVRHPHTRTYVRVAPCCCCDRYRHW
jgi:hypothetical protein